MTEAREPADLGVAGRALWAAVNGPYALDGHELALLAQAARTADRVAALDEIVVIEGVMLDDPKRGQIAHPALVEARQQRALLGRLLAQLRLPDGDDQRPQRRGARGFYGPPRAVPNGA